MSKTETQAKAEKPVEAPSRKLTVRKLDKIETTSNTGGSSGG